MDNECSPIEGSVKKCPFLHGLAKDHGEKFARAIALNPTCPVEHQRPKPLVQEISDLNRSFEKFHGPFGIVPLASFEKVIKGNIVVQSLLQNSSVKGFNEGFSSRPQAICPFSSDLRGSGTLSSPVNRPTAFPALLQAAPFASLSLAYSPAFVKDATPRSKAVPQPHVSKRPAISFVNAREEALKRSSVISENHSKHNSQLSILRSDRKGKPDTLGANLNLTHNTKKVQPKSFPSIFYNKNGHLQCPEPIVKMRAALAATRPVRELRPHPLHIKFAAIAAVAALVNLPCGMWREHCAKFSVNWFIAVHATIPFVAMLRKAVIMPKYAILITLAAAIGGQTVGSRLERCRLQGQLLEAAPAVVRMVDSPVRVASVGMDVAVC